MLELNAPTTPTPSVGVRSAPAPVAFLDARHASWYGAQKSLETLLDATRNDLDIRFVTTADGVLAEEMRGRGHHVDILPLGAHANVFGGQAIRGGPLRKLLVLRDVIRFWLRARRWLVQQEIEVAYANDIRALLLLGPPARTLGIPVVWYVRGDEALRLNALGARIATRIVLIADAVKDRAFSASTRKAAGDRFRTVYTGFDCEAYRPQPGDRERVRKTWGLAPSDRVIGLVGSLTPRKGHDLIIKALPEVLERATDVHVVMVGDAPSNSQSWVREQKRVARELGVESHIHWVGYHEPIREAYAGMDVLALPSRSEGLPRVVIEALAAGVPAVATDTGGVREILTHSDLGSVVPESDSSVLAAHLSGALDNQSLHGWEAREERVRVAKARFTIPRYREDFLRVIRELDGRGLL